MDEQPTVQCFDASDGKQLQAADPGGCPAVRIDVAGDGKTIAALGKDGRLRVLGADLHVAKDLGAAWAPAADVPAEFALGPDGSRLAVVSGWKSVDIYDARAGERVKRLEDFAEGVNCVAISGNGLLAVGCGGHVRENGLSPGVVYVVELATGRIVTKLD